MRGIGFRLQLLAQELFVKEDQYFVEEHQFFVDEHQMDHMIPSGFKVSR